VSGARPLAGRVALVTGASRGIGAAVAVELGRLGAHVVATARTQGGLEETDDAIRAAGGEAATLLPLDLTAGGEVDAIGPSLWQRFGRLDALVHCAGVLGLLTPLAHLRPKVWDEALALDLTAAWRLIRTCEPPLRAANAGRAVFLTSARAPLAYWGVYGTMQAALAHLVLTWADEVARTRLCVNLCDPGVVKTRLRAQAMPAADFAAMAKPEDVAPAIAAFCLPGETRRGELVRLAGRPAPA
jgi:NAD(P)-dependent dehydrogenase (short-subunit alcohol dehydrogenase family)